MKYPIFSCPLSPSLGFLHSSALYYLVAPAAFFFFLSFCFFTFLCCRFAQQSLTFRTNFRTATHFFSLHIFTRLCHSLHGSKNEGNDSVYCWLFLGSLNDLMLTAGCCCCYCFSYYSHFEIHLKFISTKENVHIQHKDWQNQNRWNLSVRWCECAVRACHLIYAFVLFRFSMWLHFFALSQL